MRAPILACNSRLNFPAVIVQKSADSRDIFEQGVTAMSHSTQVISGSLCSFALLGFLAGSDAHQTVSGWVYPPACCQVSGVRGDCQAISSVNVTKSTHGYFILVHPGDHHLATRYHRFFVPYGDEIPSGDQNYHISLHPTEDNLNCFFAPPDAV